MVARTHPPSFDLVIFDCDGVLVDSEVIACRAVAETLAEIGHGLTPEAVAERFTGMSDRDMYAALAQDRGAPLPAGFDAAMNARAAALFAQELRAIPGVAAVLAGLALARCVASSSTPEMLAQKLAWTGLAPWFGAAIFSTALVARGKPAPDIFLYAAERLGAGPARCLVIEDSLPGIRAAKAAGMTAFGFAGGSHCRAGHDEMLVAAGADLVFSAMRDLPRLIAEHGLSETRP
jgi:HAD superfamily hydrolase (TIGR01509 family)